MNSEFFSFKKSEFSFKPIEIPPSVYIRRQRELTILSVVGILKSRNTGDFERNSKVYESYQILEACFFTHVHRP